MWFRKSSKNIVVTGAKGQLGSYLVKYLSNKALYKSYNIGSVVGIDIDDLDLRCPERVSAFFSLERIKHIDYVVHCAAATDTTAIEKNPIKFYEANVVATRNLARTCASNGIKFIMISTDYVLSELSTYVDGEMIEFPVNQYGLQKLLAEKEVQLAYAGKPRSYCILRSSWMFGNSTKSFVEKIIYAVFKHLGQDKASGKLDMPNPSFMHDVADDAYGRPTHVDLVSDYVCRRILGGVVNNIANCQHDAPQISRCEWASIIVQCLLKHAKPYARNYPSLSQAIAVLKATSMAINPVHSSELGAGLMRHPGQLMHHFTHTRDKSVYAIDTATYVSSNIERLLSLASSAYEEGEVMQAKES